MNHLIQTHYLFFLLSQLFFCLLHFLFLLYLFLHILLFLFLLLLMLHLTFFLLRLLQGYLAIFYPISLYLHNLLYTNFLSSLHFLMNHLIQTHYLFFLLSQLFFCLLHFLFLLYLFLHILLFLFLLLLMLHLTFFLLRLLQGYLAIFYPISLYLHNLLYTIFLFLMHFSKKYLIHTHYLAFLLSQQFFCLLHFLFLLYLFLHILLFLFLLLLMLHLTFFLLRLLQGYLAIFYPISLYLHNLLYTIFLFLMHFSKKYLIHTHYLAFLLSQQFFCLLHFLFLLYLFLHILLFLFLFLKLLMSDLVFSLPCLLTRYLAIFYPIFLSLHNLTCTNFLSSLHFLMEYLLSFLQFHFQIQLNLLVIHLFQKAIFFSV